MMKYNKPQISITIFSEENIVTESIVPQADSLLLSPHTATTVTKGAITYENSQKANAILQMNQ